MSKIKKGFYILLLSLIINFVLSNIGLFNLINNDYKDVKAIYSVDKSENKSTLNISTGDIKVQNIKIYYKEKSLDNIMFYTPTVVVYGLEKDERILLSKYTNGNKNVKLNINSENKTMRLKVNMNVKAIDLIDKIVINDTSLEFSLARFIFIFVFINFIYFIKKCDKSRLFKNSKSDNRKFYLVILMLFVGIICELMANDIHFSLKDSKNISYERNFLNAQVESIIKGKVNIGIRTDKKFRKLTNSFDHTLRISSKLYDHDYIDYSYYKGKFYSYFGLSPLLFMLPFKIITGYYINNFSFSFILFVVMTLLMAKIYRMLVCKYVKEVTYFNYVLGFITLFFSSSVLLLVRGMVYDIEILSAINYTLLSFIIIMSIFNNPKKRYLIKMFLCGVCSGLIVLSKPSFIIYYILIFYLIFKLKNKVKQNYIKGIILYFIPLIIFGIIQMYWNYIRFDSIFCFGDIYQITTYDMKNLIYITPNKLMKGMLQYLFTLPDVNYNFFPFLFLKDFNYMNYDFNVIMFDMNILGIFVLPISWIYIFYNKIRTNKSLSKELIKITNILLIISFILLIVNIRNGVASIYIADIKLFLYLLGIIIYFKLIEKNDKNLVNIFYVVCFISIFISFLMYFSLGLDRVINFLEIDNAFKVIMQEIFSFWL